MKSLFLVGVWCGWAAFVASDDLNSGSGDFWNISFPLNNVSEESLESYSYACCNEETTTITHFDIVIDLDYVMCHKEINNFRTTPVQCPSGSKQKFCCAPCCSIQGDIVDSALYKNSPFQPLTSQLENPNGQCDQDARTTYCKADDEKKKCCNLLSGKTYHYSDITHLDGDPAVLTKCIGHDPEINGDDDECKSLISQKYFNGDSYDDNKLMCCAVPDKKCDAFTSESTCINENFCFWAKALEVCFVKNEYYRTKDAQIRDSEKNLKNEYRSCEVEAQFQFLGQSYHLQRAVALDTNHYPTAYAKLNSGTHVDFTTTKSKCPDYGATGSLYTAAFTTSTSSSTTTTPPTSTGAIIGCCHNYFVVWPIITDFATDCFSDSIQISNNPSLCCTNTDKATNECHTVDNSVKFYTESDKKYCCATGSSGGAHDPELKVNGKCSAIGMEESSVPCLKTEKTNEGEVKHTPLNVHEADDTTVCCHTTTGDIKPFSVACDVHYVQKERQDCHPKYPHPDPKYISVVYLLGFVGSLSVNLIVGLLFTHGEQRWIYGIALFLWISISIIGLVQTIESLNYDNLGMLNGKIGETKPWQYLGIVSSAVNAAAGLTLMIVWIVEFKKSEKDTFFVPYWVKIPLWIFLALQAFVAFCWAACSEGTVSQAHASVIETHVIAIGIFIFLIASVACPVSSTTWKSLADHRTKRIAHIVNLSLRLAAVTLTSVGMFLILSNLRNKESEDKWLYDSTLAAPIILLSSLIFYIVFLIIVNANVCALSNEKVIKGLGIFANSLCVSGFVLVIVVFARLAQTLERHDWHFTNNNQKKIHQEALVAVVGVLLFALPSTLSNVEISLSKRENINSFSRDLSQKYNF